MKKIEEKVLETIEKYKMFEPQQSVVIGLSGGKDSITLASVLNSLKNKIGINLKAVHVNHNLRGAEAKRDEDYVRKFCKKEGIPLKVYSFDVKKIADERQQGLEECGRDLRYEAFEESGADKIATAHTLSDSVETVLFNMARGSGTKGLCGIPAVRDNIVRPLIECTTQEVVEYLNENDIEFVTDSTNNSLEYSRNIFRHKIIPEFKEINPSFELAVEKMSEILRCNDEYIHSKAVEELGNIVDDKGRYSAEKIVALPDAVKYEVLRMVVERQTGVIPEYRHVKSISALLNGSGSVQINGGVTLRTRKGFLEFPEKDEFEPFCVELKEGKNQISGGEIEVFVKNCEQIENFTNKMFSFMLDYDKIKGILLCRSRKFGDSFYDGKRKCTKTLKDFFNENSIPPEYRGIYPVFEIGGKVVGTACSSVSKEYAVDRETKRILCIVYRRKSVNGRNGE